MSHPFRFCMQLAGAESGPAWRDLARKVEDLGYSTLSVADHFGDQWAPLVALTAAAEATTTLKVGTLVADNDYRHPLMLAKEAMTLDLLSGGRLELGIGAGWMRTDYDQAGIAYDEPKVRVARMEEAVGVIKGLWANETFSHSGPYYQLDQAQGLPRTGREQPTLMIGGGSKKVLSIAGREADIVGINPSLRSGAIDASAAASTLDEMVDQRVAWVREAAGDRFADIELQMLTMYGFITDDPEGMADQLAPAFGLTGAQALASPSFLAGSVEQICETLIARRERWGLSYIGLHLAELDTFAPVVARLAGT